MAFYKDVKKRLADNVGALVKFDHLPGNWVWSDEKGKDKLEELRKIIEDFTRDLNELYEPYQTAPRLFDNLNGLLKELALKLNAMQNQKSFKPAADIQKREAEDVNRLLPRIIQMSKSFIYKETAVIDETIIIDQYLESQSHIIKAKLDESVALLKGREREKIINSEKAPAQPFIAYNPARFKAYLGLEMPGVDRFSTEVVCPLRVIAFCRALKLAEVIDEFGPKTLDCCLLAVGLISPHSFDRAHYKLINEEIINKIGKEIFEKISKMVPKSMDEILDVLDRAGIAVDLEELYEAVRTKKLEQTSVVRARLQEYKLLENITFLPPFEFYRREQKEIEKLIANNKKSDALKALNNASIILKIMQIYPDINKKLPADFEIDKEREKVEGMKRDILEILENPQQYLMRKMQEAIKKEKYAEAEAIKKKLDQYRNKNLR